MQTGPFFECFMAAGYVGGFISFKLKQGPFRNFLRDSKASAWVQGCCFVLAVTQEMLVNELETFINIFWPSLCLYGCLRYGNCVFACSKKLVVRASLGGLELWPGFRKATG